jgi:hypothetical protein
MHFSDKLFFTTIFSWIFADFVGIRIFGAKGFAQHVHWVNLAAISVLGIGLIYINIKEKLNEKNKQK